ncbi:MAG: hypothetical protein OHK0021_09390 [Bryobacter sp.]
MRVAALLCCAVVLSAHGVHMSTTSVDYRSETQTLEILIAVSTQHLEEILAQHHKRRVELDRTPDAEALVKQYLFSRFSFKQPDGKFLPLQWVGMEVKGGNTNLYVEAKVAGENGLSLRNELLLDWQRDQVNRVLPKRDGKGKPPQLLFWSGTAGEHQIIHF